MKATFTLLLSVLFLFHFVSRSSAVDVDLYGDVRIRTWREWQRAAEGETFANGSSTRENFNMNLQGNSRVGARITVSDEFSALAEAGFSESTVNIRHLVGHWHFGAGTFSVGQSLTPVNHANSRRTCHDDRGLRGFGEPYTGRRPMLQLAVSDFKFAFVKPTGVSNLHTQDKDENESELNQRMPRLEMAYQRVVDPLTLQAFGGYHHYTMEAPGQDFDIHSYMAGTGLWWRPGNAYMRGVGYYARNVRQFGQYISPLQPGSFGSARIDDNRVIDNDTLGVVLFSGYRVNDGLSLEAGYGYIQSRDSVSGADTSKWQAYYVQARITLAKGMMVVPELAVDESRDSDERVVYLGAKWQASF